MDERAGGQIDTSPNKQCVFGKKTERERRELRYTIHLASGNDCQSYYKERRRVYLLRRERAEDHINQLRQLLVSFLSLKYGTRRERLTATLRLFDPPAMLMWSSE